MRSYNHIPASTYRLQLHAGFTFKQLEEILDYLHELGVSTIYASPLFHARPGSLHGYDITDPHGVNPAIGTLEEWRRIHRRLQQYNMSWLQDIVPNHMAYHHGNTRLYDALERGPLSPYYTWFDIDWQHPDTDLAGKVIAPFLGRSLEDCVAAGEIQLAITANGYTVNYFEQVFPLSVSAYQALLSVTGNSDALPVQQLLTGLYQQATAGASLEEWNRSKQSLLSPLLQQEPGQRLLQAVAAQVNNNPALLLQVLQQQHYQLAHWQETDRRINYRRFFTVNELICLRMETPAVFNEYHRFLHTLYQSGLIQGLRIDHIDGLRDPAGYIRQLRGLFGNQCYIIAEKILESSEALPGGWAVQGTSGYEFLAYANHLLSSAKGAEKLRRRYKELLPAMDSYEQLVMDKKRLILEKYMNGEWDNLVRYCYALKLADTHIDRNQLKEALGLFMVCLPVYRLYPDTWPPDPHTLSIVKQTFERAYAMDTKAANGLALLESLWEDTSDHEQARHRLQFLQRLMQFTGPLTAKGVEDTTFYIYNALLSHNEVGDSPAVSGFSTDTFHRQMSARQQHTPLSLNTTSTHDTKRGEDARIRLNMLTLLADEWQELVRRWREVNQPFITYVNHAPAPGLNDEYFLYQSIAAGFPAGGEVTPEYTERLQQYYIKALREAKVNTSWAAPDEAYEKAAIHFIQQLLTEGSAFLGSLRPFLEKIDAQAFTASLVQALVKITAPGIPDIYQGCELWDYSYVDPDNRRPVDYARRREYLLALQQKEQEGMEALLAYLAQERRQGVEKMYVTWKALQYRRAHNGLFLEGEYLPLQSNPAGAVAYARYHRQQWAMVIAPLPGAAPPKGSLPLPANAPARWRNLFTGETWHVLEHLPLGDVLKKFPLALLTAEG